MEWVSYSIVLPQWNEKQIDQGGIKIWKEKTVEGEPREFVQFQSKKVKNMYARKSVWASTLKKVATKKVNTLSSFEQTSNHARKECSTIATVYSSWITIN
jgi:hypothetical protein